MISRIQLAAVLVLCSASLCLAQGGGKAEPNRIEFKRGTYTTTVTGQVKDEQEVEYSVAAKKGQRPLPNGFPQA